MLGKLNVKVHTQIMIGIVMGLIVGILFRENALIFEPVGDLFIRFLKMIIVPIIFSSLVVGIMSLGNVQSLGRLGARTFGYYAFTTANAVLIGLVVVNLVQPGHGAELNLVPPSPTTLSLEQASESVSLVKIVRDIVPSNIFQAVVEENMLGVIFFSIVFGCALLALGRKHETLYNFVHGINDVILKMTDWIMYIAPYGVFALMASIVGRTGLSAIKPLALYMTAVLVALVVHVLITYSSLLIIIARYSPISFFKKMFPAFATAFSTDSSVATLPVTMDCLEKRVGISSKITSFVTPLGATLNMDGTALYEAVGAMFIAQIYGIEMSLTQQLVIFVTASLASVGAAGIPSAGLVTMVIVLKAVGLPLEGIGLLLVVERILDMCRTMVNVMGDSCGAIVLAHLDGERVSG